MLLSGGSAECRRFPHHALASGWLILTPAAFVAPGRAAQPPLKRSKNAGVPAGGRAPSPPPQRKQQQEEEEEEGEMELELEGEEFELELG